MPNLPIAPATIYLPGPIAAAGDDAKKHFLEFFAATIRNSNTRAAYVNAWKRFAEYLDARGIMDIRDVQTLHSAEYIELLTQERAASTVKQHRAALSRCFDYLVISQVISSNPMAAVKGPKVRQRKGTTPYLEAGEFLQLLDSVGLEKKSDLRDRAILCVMAYSWCRVSSVVNLKRQDYFDIAKRSFIRVTLKGGETKDKPLHPAAVDALEAYLATAAISEPDAPLFPALNPDRKLSTRPLNRMKVWKMVKRRAKSAGLDPSKIRTHTFRATGATNFRRNNGSLEAMQTMLDHVDPRTSQIYDHSDQEIRPEDIDKMRFER